MTKVPFIQSLAGRMLIFAVLPTMIVIGVIVTLGAMEAYRELRLAEEHVLQTSTEGAATELNSRNQRWNNVVAVMAEAQAHGLFGDRAATTDFVRSVKAGLPLIVGAYVFYEPDADGQDAESLKNAAIARESMDSTGRFVGGWYTDEASGAGSGSAQLRPATGLESLSFYTTPKSDFARTRVPVAHISEPYDYVGELEISHTYPIVVDGRFAGIAGVDRDLDTLADIAEAIKARIKADVFVLSAEGRFLVATTDSHGSKTLRMTSVDQSAYAAIGKRWQESSKDIEVFEARDPVLNERCFYSTAHVDAGDWIVVTRRTSADVMHVANAAVRRDVLIGVVGIIIVGGLLRFITLGIIRRVQNAASVSDRIARGDLTESVQECNSRDETGILIRSMGTMDKSLNALIGSVKQSSIRLNSTATEISATSKQQEASASTFGAASSQIAAAVKEISATGKDLVRTMESVSTNAVETAALAGKGKAGLEGMEAVMLDLDRATTSIAEKLGAINERSQKITTVITTITKVADQTNILSINAAIEAEKAGEFGSGFLVIAREIRRLADQTASATLDIEQMVQQMQAAVSAGVMEMDRFSDQVRRGVRDVASAGSQLTEIIDRVNRSTQSFEQVNESMQAQSEGAQQISEAMTSLSANAHQTMQSVQEFGKAATDLQSAIGVLRQSVAQFQLKE